MALYLKMLVKKKIVSNYWFFNEMIRIPWDAENKKQFYFGWFLLMCYKSHAKMP